MSPAPTLAYCARSLAAPDATVRDIAREWDLALELADDGALDVPFWRAAGVPVATVQAWWLHDAHPIHPDPDRRAHALDRMRATIELTTRVGAPRLLAVCGFGDDVADRPFERCVDFFGALLGPLRDAGLVLLLEPLSPRRCSVLWDPEEIVRMAAELDAPDVVRLCLDTGHLVDSGFELDEFFAKFTSPVEEIQLKGPRSAPPRTIIENPPKVTMGLYRGVFRPNLVHTAPVRVTHRHQFNILNSPFTIPLPFDYS